MDWERIWIYTQPLVFVILMVGWDIVRTIFLGRWLRNQINNPDKCDENKKGE